MKLMALELDDKDMMVISFFNHSVKERQFSKPSSGLEWLETKFLIELFLGSSSNGSSYCQSDVILNRF